MIFPIATPEAPLVFAGLLAMSIWVGGFVAIVVVARVSRGCLDLASRIAFFRGFGRAWGIVGGGALAIAIASGAALLSERDWDPSATAAVLVTGALVLAVAAGVTQAKWMTRARERELRSAADHETTTQVRRGSLVAAVLRAMIGALTLTLLILVAVLTTS